MNIEIKSGIVVILLIVQRSEEFIQYWIDEYEKKRFVVFLRYID